MKPSLVVFLHSHRYDRLYQAISLLLAASSMGWKCHLFLFYGALASYMKGSWDEVNITSDAGEALTSAHPLGSGPGTLDREPPDPPWMRELEKGFEAGDFPSLYEMLETAREETGGLQVCACSASCKVLGLDLGAVREKVDEVVGLHTMLRIAEDVRHVMYI